MIQKIIVTFEARNCCFPTWKKPHKKQQLIWVHIFLNLCLVASQNNKYAGNQCFLLALLKPKSIGALNVPSSHENLKNVSL